MYSVDKTTGDIVLTFTDGITPSPHKGTAAIKNANLSTEAGEVMCNFPRISQLTSYAGNIVFTSNSGGADNFTITGLSAMITVGAAITIPSGAGPAAGNYYIRSVTGTIPSQTVTLATDFNGTGYASSSGGTNKAFTTVGLTSAPVQSATEQYFDGTLLQYRYFILEKAGFVWVYDTGATWSTNGWTIVNLNHTISLGTGLAVLNGYLHAFNGLNTFAVLTANLNASLSGGVTANILLGNNATSYAGLAATSFSNYCLVGHEATLNFCNGSVIGTVQPSSVSSALNANVWSYGQWTYSSADITVTKLFGGQFPVNGQTMTVNATGTIPTGLSANTVYYVVNAAYNTGIFQLSASVGGSAISLSGGAGTYYFNSYSPQVSSTFVYTPQACQLPQFEYAQALAELGSSLVIGTMGNTLYQWNQVAASPDNFVPLPENNCTFLLTVNNVVYAFAGQKGNIYVTNGSSASVGLSVPDYLAGVPGTASSYIEPYFVWGQAFFARGRVFFSIQDQTSSKTGNCGGIFSFIPAFFNAVTGEDAGSVLRLENVNSYATYNGLANVLFASQNQSAIGVQYFSAWTSSVSGPSYGIDASGTYPTVTAIIESDLIPTGWILGEQPQTFANIEYRLAAPLVSGESIAINYRANATAAFATAGTMITESATDLAGYISPLPFEKTKWLQLQVQLIPNGTATFSGNRLTEIRIRTT